MSEKNDFYVYAWFFKEDGHIFHIGKGRGNRCYDTKNSRNSYFKNIIDKYKDEVSVKKLTDSNLTDKQAAELERKLIAEYKLKGECETNLHEGGFGGNTGNYEKASKSLKEFYKKNGPLKSTLDNCKKMNDAVRGKPQTEEHKKRLSESHKNYWANLTEEEYQRIKDSRKGRLKGRAPWNLGKEWSDETKFKIFLRVSHKYEVYFEGKLVYWCLGLPLLKKFCKSNLGVGPSLIGRLIRSNAEYDPRLKRDKHLKSLMIKDVGKLPAGSLEGVSTIPDECREVERIVRPFEVRDNQFIWLMR